MHQVRIALRQFAKSPGFAVTVILTIALGIGANTAIFTLVHSILLQSLPVSDPKTLYRVGDQDDCCVSGGFQNDNGDFDLFSWDAYERFRKNTPEFEKLAAMQAGGERLTVRRGNEGARSERTEYVSGNYFDTFGIRPMLGRMLSEADDTEGAAPVGVLSYDAWQSEFGGDARVIGESFSVQSKPVTIVGVAPPGFFGDRMQNSPPALWVPLASEPGLNGKNSILKVPDSAWLYVVGRMKPGVDPKVLEQKMSSQLRDWMLTVPGFGQNGNATLIPRQHVVIVPAGAGIQNLQKQTGKGLMLLMSISALVLLVACANVANLLLARIATRKSEIAIRMAMGAARSTLMQQMLTESVLLALFGGVAGLVLAYGGSRMILALAFPDSPHLPISATPSFLVLGFAFLLSLATGVLFGVVPAWITSRSDPAESMRGVNRSTRDQASLPQRSLIVLQAALSLVLMVGAGLLTRSLGNLQHQDFGLKTDHRYVVHIDPAGAGYTLETLPAFYQQLEADLQAIPGVQSTGLALYSTLEGNNWGEAVYVQGRPAPGPSDQIGSSWDRVSPRFFETVGQPVLRGRGFTEDDTATSLKVAVVNQAFVKKFFPKEDPIGRHFGTGDPKYSGAYEIVGVVADAKYTNPRDIPRPMYFRSVAQRMAAFTEANAVMGESRSMYINSVTLHFAQTPQNVDSAIRGVLMKINPNLTIIDLHSLDYQVSGNFSQEKLVARLTMLFGVLALVLASVGLYGITAYQVARRTSEIGLRMALGANRMNVLKLVLSGAMRQAGLGLLIGIPLAILAAHLMADQLYNVRAYDPWSLMGSVAVLACAAAVAGFIPSRRASRIEPMVALRTD